MMYFEKKNGRILKGTLIAITLLFLSILILAVPVVPMQDASNPIDLGGETAKLDSPLQALLDQSCLLYTSPSPRDA